MADPKTASPAPAAAQTPAISFSNVSKRYPGGYEALTAVSFDVAPGELVFISGHSGAGKSTLLKLVPAIERASTGTVLVNGQNVSAMKRGAIPYLRRNLGLIFQDQKLLNDRSAFDNVLLPLQLSGSAPAEAARRARAALDKVGLLAREKAIPITLSGVKCRSDPSMCERKVTPSSVTALSDASENTWNPPESVRIGPFHPMNRCRPPSVRITSSPGRRCR